MAREVEVAFQRKECEVRSKNPMLLAKTPSNPTAKMAPNTSAAGWKGQQAMTAL
jgi:hypothetical protein